MKWHQRKRWSTISSLNHRNWINHVDKPFTLNVIYERAMNDCYGDFIHCFSFLFFFLKVERERKMDDSFVRQLELAREFFDASCHRCQRSISNKTIRNVGMGRRVGEKEEVWGCTAGYGCRTMRQQLPWRHGRPGDVTTPPPPSHNGATDSLAWFSSNYSTMAQCGVHRGWWIHKRTSQHCSIDCIKGRRIKRKAERGPPPRRPRKRQQFNDTLHRLGQFQIYCISLTGCISKPTSQSTIQKQIACNQN